MRWSGRSASPARRWWDRAARRHARRGSKIPEDDRSFFFLYDFTHAAMGGIGRRLVPTRWSRCQKNHLHLGHAGSVLFFAARSDAVVWPPPRLVRLRESCMPWVGIGARFELSVRELTPIHEISEDSLPYSILGQRFITTLRPAASAFAAAASSRAPSCIQIIFGGGVSSRASSTTGMMWLEFRKMSTMSTGRPISRSDATKGFPSRLLPRWPGLTGIMS